MLAGLVEGLLNRLKVEVKDVRVRLRFQGGKEGEGGMEVEVRLGRVGYRDEGGGAAASKSSTTAPAPAPGGAEAGDSVKTLRVSSIAVLTRRLPPTPTRRRPTTTALTSSLSSSSSSEDDEADSAAETMMSQAVVDLRESTILGGGAGSEEGGSSVYERIPSPRPLRSSRRTEDSTPDPSLLAVFFPIVLLLAGIFVYVRWARAKQSKKRESSI
ncbi:hypothetical protein BDY24DRAFT_444846 [Mrakia frigida]|uniref:uncharacterized protein n=1 Tax=Mrakia frigida TaxID=29902 RepID=UPI003FCC2470